MSDHPPPELKLVSCEIPEDVRAEAEEMLVDPNLIERAMDDVATLGVAGERDLVGMIYLAGTSRLLARPLAVIVQGPSSSGKSHLIENTAKLFPPEATIHATRITPQALFHMEPGSLSHRFVVAGERTRGQNDEASETTKALREMLSSGKLTKLTTEKSDGVFKTQYQEQQGPIAYVESTSLTRIFDEDANRCVILTTDERPEQTKHIVDELAAGYVAGERPVETERIIERHHALQQLLEPLDVVIPYAEKVGKLFKTERVEARRAFPHLMNAIKAVTLLYQRQRERDDKGRLIATDDDYRMVHRLMAEPMSRLLGGGVSPPAKRFCERLRGRFPKGGFDTRRASQGESVGDRAIRGYLSELRRARLVEVIVPATGRRPALWQFTEKTLDEGQVSGLPSPEEVFGDTDFQHSSNT